jgi:hypothetical protein
MILTYEGSKIYEIVTNHSMTIDEAVEMAGIEYNEDTLSPECFDLVDESTYTQPVDYLETIKFLKSENVNTYIINSPINQTVTATEAATILNITVRGVRDNCERGKYTCRKSGSTWLIDITSL